MTHKKELLKRFKELYPGKRLLAVLLDGFSHAIFYDDGTSDSDVEFVRYSAYTGSKNGVASKLFEGYSHYMFQNNPKEYVFVKPIDR